MNTVITNTLVPVNILLVDDREENLYSLQNLLDYKQHDVCFIHATSGNEALKIIYKTEIALILLDVQMPEMDGYEMATILKQNKHTQHIPIIFVTAVNQENRYVTEGYSKGAVDYLFKPLDPIITRSKVNSFISIHLQQKKIEQAYKELEQIVIERTADLQIKNEALSRMNKDLDQFVYVASHDLKLPIANFEGLILALREDLKNVDQNFDPILSMLEYSVVKMKDTINGLISIIQSSEREEVFEEINCESVLEEVEKSVSRLIQETGAAIIRKGAFYSNFEFNKITFKSVLYNLITNAVKYHQPGRKPEIEISFRKEGNRVVLSVKDNGMGMDDTEVKRLFRLFSRIHTESNTEGTGMGLYNLKNMLDKYGASMEVSSRKGEGSEFKVFFMERSVVRNEPVLKVV